MIVYSFDEKQRLIKEEFASCMNKEEKYQKIIDIGKKQSPLNDIYKKPENIVKGCQSTVYLHSYCEKDTKRIFFEAESDALISNGLAALLVNVYSGETAETILQFPPLYLEELDIPELLSPSRANGLSNIHLKIKQEALKYIL